MPTREIMAAVKDYIRGRSIRADVTRRTKASELTLRQSLFPLIIVTALFFLWGFSYGLLDTLNAHFQRVLHFTPSRSSGLQAAYFGFVNIFHTITTALLSVRWKLEADAFCLP